METSPWQDYWQKIRPSVFDIIVGAVVTLMVLVVVLLPTVIIKHQLFIVENAVLAQLAHGFTAVLVGIDSVKFSATIVTFLLWGLVGLITYGIIMGIIRFWQYTEMLKEMVSGEFVHPAGFSARRYWRTLALHEGVNIAVILLGLTCVLTVAFALLPAATVHARTLVLSWSWPVAAQAAAATVLLWAGALTVILCLKAWRYRRALWLVAA